MNTSFLIIFSALGFLLSFYTFYVERQLRRNQTYKAFCDMSEKISCSRVFLSPEGHLFGVSNAVVGIFFYILLVYLISLQQFFLVFLFSAVALVGSFYLFYLQFFRLRLYCLVCILIYTINLGLFLGSVFLLS